MRKRQRLYFGEPLRMPGILAADFDETRQGSVTTLRKFKFCHPLSPHTHLIDAFDTNELPAQTPTAIEVYPSSGQLRLFGLSQQSLIRATNFPSTAVQNF